MYILDVHTVGVHTVAHWAGFIEAVELARQIEDVIAHRRGEQIALHSTHDRIKPQQVARQVNLRDDRSVG